MKVVLALCGLATILQAGLADARDDALISFKDDVVSKVGTAIAKATSAPTAKPTPAPTTKPVATAKPTPAPKVTPVPTKTVMMRDTILPTWNDVVPAGGKWVKIQKVKDYWTSLEKSDLATYQNLFATAAEKKAVKNAIEAYYNAADVCVRRYSSKINRTKSRFNKNMNTVKKCLAKTAMPKFKVPVTVSVVPPKSTYVAVLDESGPAAAADNDDEDKVTVTTPASVKVQPSVSYTTPSAWTAPTTTTSSGGTSGTTVGAPPSISVDDLDDTGVDDLEDDDEDYDEEDETTPAWTPSSVENDDTSSPYETPLLGPGATTDGDLETSDSTWTAPEVTTSDSTWTAPAVTTEREPEATTSTSASSETFGTTPTAENSGGLLGYDLMVEPVVNKIEPATGFVDTSGFLDVTSPTSEDSGVKYSYDPVDVPVAKTEPTSGYSGEAPSGSNTQTSGTNDGFYGYDEAPKEEWTIMAPPLPPVEEEIPSVPSWEQMHKPGLADPDLDRHTGGNDDTSVKTIDAPPMVVEEPPVLDYVPNWEDEHPPGWNGDGIPPQYRDVYTDSAFPGQPLSPVAETYHEVVPETPESPMMAPGAPRQFVTGENGAGVPPSAHEPQSHPEYDYKPSSPDVPPFWALDFNSDNDVTTNEWGTYLQKVKAKATATNARAKDPQGKAFIDNAISFHYANQQDRISQYIQPHISPTDMPHFDQEIISSCYVKFRYSLFGGAAPFEWVAKKQPEISADQISKWFEKQFQVAKRDVAAGRITANSLPAISMVKKSMKCLVNVLHAHESESFDRAKYYKLLEATKECVDISD